MFYAKELPSSEIFCNICYRYTQKNQFYHCNSHLLFSLYGFHYFVAHHNLYIILEDTKSVLLGRLVSSFYFIFVFVHSSQCAIFISSLPPLRYYPPTFFFDLVINCITLHLSTRCRQNLRTFSQPVTLPRLPKSTAVVMIGIGIGTITLPPSFSR